MRVNNIKNRIIYRIASESIIFIQVEKMKTILARNYSITTGEDITEELARLLKDLSAAKGEKTVITVKSVFIIQIRFALKRATVTIFLMYADSLPEFLLTEAKMLYLAISNSALITLLRLLRRIVKT